MEKKELDSIREMVVHGLYKTALTNGYGAEVFRAFKDEQIRLFDSFEENIKRLKAAGVWSEKAESNMKALKAAEMWSEGEHQDYQSEQKGTKRKLLAETGSDGE